MDSSLKVGKDYVRTLVGRLNGSRESINELLTRGNEKTLFRVLKMIKQYGKLLNYMAMPEYDGKKKVKNGVIEKEERTPLYRKLISSVPSFLEPDVDENTGKYKRMVETHVDGLNWTMWICYLNSGEEGAEKFFDVAKGITKRAFTLDDDGKKELYRRLVTFKPHRIRRNYSRHDALDDIERLTE